ncbi:MAG: AAA family ATPase [Sphaerochaetaceae bacterium]|nr:AAA family ATPase [Sphaerochaetaceae bacterium]
MSKQLLPIMTANGSFENLRRGGYVYVDKTSYLHSLVRQEGNMFFLSRPRRFGKTLTVSTLEAIFQGRRELFKGLAIDALDYDWKTYPIIHIDFGDCGKSTPEGLDGWLKDQIEEIADLYGVGPLDMTKTSDDLFAKLILLLSKKDKVVALVDEYDKVLSDNVFSEQVEELRTVLGNFYQVVKTKGALLRFVFITGVTRYAMVNEFSGMNNLNNISMDSDYATMLGYTQEELEGNFAGYIEQGIKDTGMGREAYLGKVREMYDGYRFAPGCETVYNPVSVGLFFSNGHGKAFKNFWFDTGSTKLVMDMAGSVDLDVTEDLGMGMDADALSEFDVAELKGMRGDINKVQAFLLQTGYLTIESGDESMLMLRFPNAEVRNAYSKSLLRRLYGPTSQNVIMAMEGRLKEGDTSSFMEILAAFFAKIPYKDARKESDFAQVVDALVAAMGADVRMAGEDRTSAGRIDLTVETDRHVYVMEFKADKSAEAALRQIKDKHYADKFRLERGKTIHLLGIAFSSTGHTVQEWKEEILA